MPYGSIAVLPGGLRERFESGAFGPDVASADVIANWQHMRESPDLAGRARGFSSMVSAGMPLDKAAALAGLLSAEA